MLCVNTIVKNERKRQKKRKSDKFHQDNSKTAFMNALMQTQGMAMYIYILSGF